MPRRLYRAAYIFLKSEIAGMLWQLFFVPGLKKKKKKKKEKKKKKVRISLR